MMKNGTPTHSDDAGRAGEVIRFWTQDLTPADWYRGGEDLDSLCRARFGDLWSALAEGRLEHWRRDAMSCYAYVLLGDQLSRNIHRGSGLAFACDVRVRAAVWRALQLGWDLQTEGAARQFWYLPLEHSESLQDQARAVRLILTRLPEAEDTLLHARVHREIIRRFGRFPARNAALGRVSTAPETAFLNGPGYGGLLHDLKADGPRAVV